MKYVWGNYPIIQMLFLWLIAIVGTIPFTIISETEYFWSAPATVSEGINTIIFVMVWFIISVYMGYNRKAYFLKFSLFYFSYLILGIMVGFIDILFPFSLFAVLLAAPFYGIQYFISMDVNLHIWGSVGTLIIVILSYLGGYYLGRSTVNKTTT